MGKKIERTMELIAFALLCGFAVKANEIKDTAHFGLYVTAALLTMAWIVLDTAD